MIIFFLISDQNSSHNESIILLYLVEEFGSRMFFLIRKVKKVNVPDGIL